MPDGKLNPLRLAPDDAARLLSKAGEEPVAEKEIRDVIGTGAPVDADGNLNLVHLGAWLLQQIAGTVRK
jgi:hypothetical protein